MLWYHFREQFIYDAALVVKYIFVLLENIGSQAATRIHDQNLIQDNIQ